MPGFLRAQPPACPGVESTTALLTGSTSTSRAAALTCWPHPLMAPGLSTSAQSVMGEKAAVRYCVPHSGPAACVRTPANQRGFEHIIIIMCTFPYNVLLFSSVPSCSPRLSVALCFQALRMMLGLDLVSVQHRNLTLNNLPVPNGEPLFQNGKNIHSCSSKLFPFQPDIIKQTM